MPDSLGVITRQAEHDRDLFVRLLRDLLAVSREGEQAAQRWVAGQLERLGCSVKVFTYHPRDLATPHEFADAAAVDPNPRTAVVGRMPGRAGRSLLLFAHPDTEPAGGLEAWRHAPFAGEIDSGRLYGWGIADDLAGVAAMIGAVWAVRAAGLIPDGAVILASTPCKRHARGIVEVLRRGYTADAALYLHPAESGNGLREIKAVTPGLLRFRIHVAGRPADTQELEHTPFHHLAVNPLNRAWLLVQALKTLDDRRASQVHHPTMDAAVGRSTNIQIGFFHAGASDRLHRVSDGCVVGGSVTFPPHEAPAQVQAQVADAVRRAAEQDPWLREHPPLLEWPLGISGAEVAPDEPVYRTVSHAIGVVTGYAPEVNPLHAASDIRHPILHGIPGVGIGPLAGNFSQAGGSDEWIDLASYLQTIEVAARVIADWCSAHPAAESARPVRSGK